MTFAALSAASECARLHVCPSDRVTSWPSLIAVHLAVPSGVTPRTPRRLVFFRQKFALNRPMAMQWHNTFAVRRWRSRPWQTSPLPRAERRSSARVTRPCTSSCCSPRSDFYSRLSPHKASVLVLASRWKNVSAATMARSTTGIGGTDRNRRASAARVDAAPQSGQQARHGASAVDRPLANS